MSNHTHRSPPFVFSRPVCFTAANRSARISLHALLISARTLRSPASQSPASVFFFFLSSFFAGCSDSRNAHAVANRQYCAVTVCCAGRAVVGQRGWPRVAERSGVQKACPAPTNQRRACRRRTPWRQDAPACVACIHLVPSVKPSRGTILMAAILYFMYEHAFCFVFCIFHRVLCFCVLFLVWQSAGFRYPRCIDVLMYYYSTV
ncbi:hypothetical protein EDC01DRAFT_261707 [Geopyxis carbonaria]|nr:hypothetical protein EDC01DRAFT_261707 [Geopyxis carbonaria]